jgi:hypothetical protein
MPTKRLWIETLLDIPIEDYRKYAIRRIIAPYLINIRKVFLSRILGTEQYAARTLERISAGINFETCHFFEFVLYSFQFSRAWLFKPYL